MTDRLMTLVTGPAISLVGFGLICLAIFGLTARKRLVLPSRWLILLLTMVALPQFAGSAVSVFGDSGAGPQLLWVVNPLLALGLLLYAWTRLKGYWLVGVTRAQAQEELEGVLRSTGVSSERTEKGLKVGPQASEIQFSEQAWLGTAQVRAEDAQGQKILEPALQKLRDSWRREPPRASAPFFAISLAAGVTLIAAGVTLLYFPTGRDIGPLALALGFADAPSERYPLMLGTASATFAGLLVTTRMCEEHLICGLALAGLFVWVFSL